MSNSRKYRRSLAQAPGRQRPAFRLASEEEIEAVAGEWADLTDERIEALLGRREHQDFEDALGRRTAELTGRYGPGAVLVGVVQATALLASHILEHEPVVGDMTAALDDNAFLLGEVNKDATERLAMAVLAAAAGMPEAAPRCVAELVAELGADAWEVAIGLWIAMCDLGAEVGVSASFCGGVPGYADPDDGTLNLDALAGSRPEGEELHILLEMAPDASGLAAGLIAALRSGDETTAAEIARSVSAFGAEEETATCLGLLGATDESGAGLIAAAGEAVAVIQQAVAAGDDEEDDDAGEEDGRIGAALRSLAGQALERGPQRSTSEVVAEVDRLVGLVRAVPR